MADELADAIDAIGRSGARAVLLRAEGPDFSFGGDIVPWPDMDVTDCAAASSRKPHPLRSRSMLVLVKDAAQTLASLYLESGDLLRIGDWRRQRYSGQAAQGRRARPFGRLLADRQSDGAAPRSHAATSTPLHPWPAGCAVRHRAA
jgi:hypothetical protein